MILKYKSFLITKILHDIKVALIYKIRKFYTRKLNDRLFKLAFKIDSKINKNNLGIIIENNNFDKFTEENRELKLLKLEAEGAEPEVIKGGIDVIKNIEYIAADLGPERGFNQEITLKEVANILLQNNFEIIDINYPRLCVLFKNLN